MYTIRDKLVVLDLPNFSPPIACVATNHQKLTLLKFCAIRYTGSLPTHLIVFLNTLVQVAIPNLCSVISYNMHKNYELYTVMYIICHCVTMGVQQITKINSDVPFS